MRGWLGRLAAVAGLVLVGVGTGAAPADAQSTSELAVSNVRTEAGKISFILTGSGLPSLAAATSGGITVSAEGQSLTPQISDTKSVDRTRLPVRGVVVVLDTGAEMAGAALAAAEVAVLGYVDGLSPDVAVGLVATTELTKPTCSLGYDRSAVRTAAGALSGAGPSALNDAIQLAVRQFDSTYSQRRIVVVTDGPDAGSTAATAEVTAALASQQIAMDVLTYGAGKPGDLAGMATGSGGTVIQAATRDELTPAVTALIAKVPAPLAVTATVPASLSGQNSALQIGVTGTDKPLTTTVSVSFAVDPNALPPMETLRLKTLPTVILYTAVGLLGLAILVLGFSAAYGLLGRSAKRERLRQLERISGKPGVSIEKSDQSSQVMRAALAVSERAVTRQGRATIETELERAGIALRPAEWYLVRAASGGIGAVLAMVLVPGMWFIALPVGLVAGWFGSNWYRKRRAASRARRFEELLPEALQLVVGALRTGFSLMQSLDAVVREGPEPVASEFGRAMAETRIGGEVEAALERTAERNCSSDLSWLVMAIRIQREVGGNLSEVVETAVETMRERGRLARHVRALSAEGRVSAWVLVGMPIGVSLWMFTFRGEYLKPLYTEPLGIALLVISVSMVVAGAFWISKLVKVEV